MDLNDPNFGNTSNSQINPNAHNFPTPSYYHNPQFYPTSQDQSNFQNVQVSQNISRNLFQENQEKQKKIRKQSTPSLWSVEEDMVLMKSWCYYSCDEIKGNNQKGEGLWARVMEMYEQYRRENPDKIGERNLDSMKGRHQRICKNVNSWVACYRKAYARKSSGMSMSDVKQEALAQYTQVNKSNFNEMTVWQEVMSNLKKWEVPTGMDMGGNQYVEEGDDIIHESEGSTKRSKTNEDGDYAIPTNPDTPTSVPTSSTISRPQGRDAAKKKRGKQKVTESSHNSEFTEEYRAMRMVREKELELSERQIQEMARLNKERDEAEKHKSYAAILNTLLAKTHLTPAQEAMIEDLTEKVMGKTF
ncbi:hypothetical protein RND81_13G158800 [Saponaria officinalis]|uniref:No apical meristem-associated C-terminal domain-containing protein n=1 Tax=Saponaria officinalis TaxID=3572 RepID=A0AAW1H1Z3_SAPOF